MANFVAAYAARQSPEAPLTGLEVGECAEPTVPDGWVRVIVRANSLNHHDLWALRGLTLDADQLPMVLGTDAAGVDEGGNDVVVHAVIANNESSDDPLFAPDRSLLSERHPGTLASWVAVPRENLIPKPPELSFAEAACLPTAWLTAYRMLTTKGQLRKGQSVLVQGAGGGVATAAIVLAQALGARVYVTSRSERKRQQAQSLGAIAFHTGARLPERVDVVVETVGEATMDHSLKCVVPGGRVVVSGATSGRHPAVDLRRVFHQQLNILGSMMGTRAELGELLKLLARTGARPVIDQTYPFADAKRAFARLASGGAFGKVVLSHPQ